MASQVIQISKDILTILSAYRRMQEAEYSPAFDIRPLPTKPMSLAVETELQELGYGSPAPILLRDFVLVLTSSDEPDPEFRPLPLPSDITAELLDRLQKAIESSVSDLTGHEFLKLTEAFAKAREKETFWQPLRREPVSAYEKRLIDAAAKAQSEMHDKLAALDTRHVALRETAIRTNMIEPLRSLALSGPIGDALRLTSCDHYCNRILIPAQLAVEVWQASDEAEVAANNSLWAYGLKTKRHNLASIQVRPYWLYELFQVAAPELTRNDLRMLWRSHEESRLVAGAPAVEAHDLEEALEAYYAAFDRKLLTGLHPVVRAALAMYEFLRIEPGAKANDKVAAFLFEGILDAADFFALPLSLVLHRHRQDVVESFVDAVHFDLPHMFVRAIVHLYGQAVELGERIMTMTAPLRKEVNTLLIANGVASKEAERLATLVVSNPLLESRQLLSWTGEYLFDTAPVLHEAGLVDRLEMDGETWWSPTMARKLTSRWTIWPSSE